METAEQQPAAETAEAQQPPAFRLFSKKNPKNSRSKTLILAPNPSPRTSTTDHGDSEPTSTLSFSDLGLSPWAVSTCAALGIRRPTAVQRRCVPHVLAGKDILAIARTGSGKTAAFALPILCRLAQDPYGVFALVVTPSRELAVQLIEQFRAFGASLNVRCCLVVGGMGMTAQAKALAERPHVVVATPGRIRFLMEQDPDIAAVFEKTKFLVLDEADRVLDVGFEEELSTIFKCLPKKRQTLLFSATKTSTLQALHEISPNSTYFYEEYEGLSTNDIDLIHAIEAETKKRLDAYECNEKEVLEDITKVFKARRVARMKMSEDGYDERAAARKKQKKRRREGAEET